MLSSDAVARGLHVSVYNKLPQSAPPHEHLRLLIGQSQSILSIEGDDIRQQTSI